MCKKENQVKLKCGKCGKPFTCSKFNKSDLCSVCRKEKKKADKIEARKKYDELFAGNKKTHECCVNHVSERARVCTRINALGRTFCRGCGTQLDIVDVQNDAVIVGNDYVQYVINWRTRKVVAFHNAYFHRVMGGMSNVWKVARDVANEVKSWKGIKSWAKNVNNA